jgi:putative ABC transport system permease protein
VPSSSFSHSRAFAMPDWKRSIRDRFEAAGRIVDQDIVDELSQHADRVHERARAEGRSADEATQEVEALIAAWCANARLLRRRPRRAAAVEPPSSRERLPLRTLLHDARYGLRLLKRQPGHTAVAILTMALGIAATTTLFSVANGVLLRPLPWAEPDRLVRVTETRQGRAGRIRGTVMNGTYLAWSDQPSTIEAIGGWRDAPMTLSGSGDPERIDAVLTTPSLFTVLKARPLLGRLFVHDEANSGQPVTVILGFGLWRDRFGGRSDIVGRSIDLDGKPYTVVGVMPRDFAFPDRHARAWVPWSIPPPIDGKGLRRGVILLSLARLRPGVTVAQAGAEGTARARGAPDAGPMAMALFGARGPIDISVTPAEAALTADVRPAILVLLVAVGLLLLTATANVASLQLARTTTRRHEMAIRAAIGASAARLAQQLLIENMMLGIGSGAAGLALAALLNRPLPALLPADFPRLEGIAIDARVLLFTVAVSLAVSVLCGLLPALHTRRVDLVEALAEDGIAPVGGTTRTPTARARTIIMMAQVAVACVLLVGASLLTRSFLALLHAARGYDPVGLLTARVPLTPQYTDERRAQLLGAVVERMRREPGVTHAAFSTALPLLSAGGYTTFKLRSPLHPDIEREVEVARRIVSPDYFAALRLRLVAGRPLTAGDGPASRPAVVINESFVTKYLDGIPPREAVSLTLDRAGVHFRNDGVNPQIVGVVEDMRQDGVDAPLQAEVFTSYAQVVNGLVGFDPVLVVRTAASPESYIATLRRLVREQAPTVALDAVMTMEDRVTASLAKPRVYAVLVGGFALFALAIAAVGLSAVLSHSIAQRTREIGVRTALGATPRDIVVLVLRQAVTMIAGGLAIGLLTAFGLVTHMSTFLYGVSAHDIRTFVAVPIGLTVIAVLACILPAKRAARADPLTALKTG